MVSATERSSRAGARVCAAVATAGCDCSDGLVDLRPSPPGADTGGNPCALAGLDAVVVAVAGERPAMGEGDVVTVDACAGGAFVGTFSTSNVCICDEEAVPVMEDEF